MANMELLTHPGWARLRFCPICNRFDAPLLKVTFAHNKFVFSVHTKQQVMQHLQCKHFFSHTCIVEYYGLCEISIYHYRKSSSFWLIRCLLSVILAGQFQWSLGSNRNLLAESLAMIPNITRLMPAARKAKLVPGCRWCLDKGPPRYGKM